MGRNRLGNQQRPERLSRKRDREKVRQLRNNQYGATFVRANWWLRDVVSGAYFANVNWNGNANCNNASNANGVRPDFEDAGKT